MSDQNKYHGIILQDKKVPLSILETRADYLRSAVDIPADIRAVPSLDSLNGDLANYSLFFVHSNDGEARKLMSLRALQPHIEVFLWWSDPHDPTRVSELLPIRGPLAYEGPLRLLAEDWKRVIPQIIHSYICNPNLGRYVHLEEMLSDVHKNPKVY
jgi:hypothetical protein